MGKRLKTYVAKKVKKTTTPKKKPKKGKPMIKKRIKITDAQIRAQAKKIGYEGKITPYIRKRLKEQIRADTP